MDPVTLDQVIGLVDQLTDEERTALREYLDCQEALFEHTFTLQRAAALHRAIEVLRHGLTEEQLDAFEWAMNFEHIARTEEQE